MTTFTDQPSTPRANLLFANPEFPSPGNTFTTVRIGGKWLAPKVGITLHFFGVDDDGGPGEEFGKGELIGRFEGNVDAIPGTFLTLNHDPEARVLPGLVSVLSYVYGADVVTEALTGDVPIVTLLIKVEELSSEKLG